MSLIEELNYSVWIELLTDEGQGASPQHKVHYAYPTMMKLGTVLPELKKVPKNIN